MYLSFQSYLVERSGISVLEFQSLLPYLKEKEIPKGTILLQKGAICTHSFFVESGLLRAYSIDSSGKEHVIQFAPEGWIITDRSSVFFNQPSDYFIETIETSNVIYFSHDFINQASDISSSFRNYNERLLQNHIRQLQHRIQYLLEATAEERYLDFISIYPDLLLRVPQWMIASYLGITPESLSRVRKELAKRNFNPKR
jgi:CRP-like cAMP-binding protein